MKKWTITIKAEDEASALTYLGMMSNTFKAAVMMGVPMNHCFLEDPDKGEATVCTLKTPRWSWVRK
jgi:hypothetical protein